MVVYLLKRIGGQKDITVHSLFDKNSVLWTYNKLWEKLIESESAIEFKFTLIQQVFFKLHIISFHGIHYILLVQNNLYFCNDFHADYRNANKIFFCLCSLLLINSQHKKNTHSAIKQTAYYWLGYVLLVRVCLRLLLKVKNCCAVREKVLVKNMVLQKSNGVQ